MERQLGFVRNLGVCSFETFCVCGARANLGLGHAWQVLCL